MQITVPQYPKLLSTSRCQNVVFSGVLLNDPNEMVRYDRQQIDFTFDFTANYIQDGDWFSINGRKFHFKDNPSEVTDIQIAAFQSANYISRLMSSVISVLESETIGINIRYNQSLLQDGFTLASITECWNTETVTVGKSVTATFLNIAVTDINTPLQKNVTVKVNYTVLFDGNCIRPVKGQLSMFPVDDCGCIIPSEYGAILNLSDIMKPHLSSTLPKITSPYFMQLINKQESMVKRVKVQGTVTSNSVYFAGLTNTDNTATSTTALFYNGTLQPYYYKKTGVDDFRLFSESSGGVEVEALNILAQSLATKRKNEPHFLYFFLDNEGDNLDVKVDVTLFDASGGIVFQGSEILPNQKEGVFEFNAGLPQIGLIAGFNVDGTSTAVYSISILEDGTGNLIRKAKDCFYRYVDTDCDQITFLFKSSLGTYETVTCHSFPSTSYTIESVIDKGGLRCNEPFKYNRDDVVSKTLTETFNAAMLETLQYGDGISILERYDAEHLRREFLMSKEVYLIVRGLDGTLFYPAIIGTSTAEIQTDYEIPFTFSLFKNDNI